MTIASELLKLQNNLDNSYTACENKGATLPASQNFDNLASTISAIPAGTTPTLASLTVTPSTTAQTLTPPSGTDGYNTVIASAVTASIDANITAENIKKDVSILGVTGSYEGSGSSTLTTKTITANGTYAASSDNADGYSSVTVNVSGGGGGNRKIAPYNCTIEYFDDLPFTKESYELVGTNSLPRSGVFLFTEENMIPVYKTNVSTYNNAYLNPSFSNQNPNYIYYFNGGSYISANVISQFYSNPANCPAVLNFGAMTTVVFANACQNLTNLQKVLFSNVTSLSLRATFKGCTNLTIVDMPKVDTLPSNALAGSASTGGAFSGCTSLQTLSFPALKSTSFGSYTNQFNYMLKGVTGCTVHFPSNLQSVIGSWTSVTGGFSGTNTTVLFDLPATT